MKLVNLVTVVALLVVHPVVANARAYFFDCGGQKNPKVILSGNYVQIGVYRVNGVATYAVTIAGVDATETRVRTPVFRWDQKTDKASLDGRQCRMLTDEEIQNLEDPQFVDPNSKVK